MRLRFFKKGRRERLRASTFSPAWLAHIGRNVPIFERLSPSAREELLGHVKIFLAEKRFEGCGGLAITDEIRVTVAALACLLLLNRDTDYYPQLTTILVYPTGYTAHEERHIGGGVWEEGPEDRLGHTGEKLRAVVLAWDAIKRDALQPNDGANLVLHEFAHQLDFEDRSSDGTPALDTRAEYDEWRRLMAGELEELRRAADAGVPTFLDQYGATDRTEFFAVATETFFERPGALRVERPALYAALQRFYKQDPASFVGAY